MKQVKVIDNTNKHIVLEKVFQDNDIVTLDSLGYNSENYTLETIEKIDIKNKRLAEYPQVLEILEIILDHGLDSQEFADLQAKRQAVKNKYPLN